MRKGEEEGCQIRSHVAPMLMSGRVNSYDVARAAKVSRAVVSAVVNGKADRYGISAKTQERVREATIGDAHQY